MSGSISRWSKVSEATITAAGTNSSAIRQHDAAWGSYEIPSGSGITSITLEIGYDTSNKKNSASVSTWSPLKDENNVLIGSIAVTAGEYYNFPSAFFNSEFGRIVALSAVGGSDVVIPVFLKG